MIKFNKVLSILCIGVLFCASNSFAQIARTAGTTTDSTRQILVAAKNRDLNTVKNLVNSGVDINKRDAQGNTIYCTALRQNDNETASILKSFGGTSKGCPGIDPTKKVAAATAAESKSGIFGGIRNGTAFLVAGAAVGVGAMLFAGGDDSNSPAGASNDGNSGGDGPIVIPDRPTGGQTFYVPFGANGAYTLYMENDRTSAVPIYQTKEYDRITLNKYSAQNFNTDFEYKYYVLGIASSQKEVIRSDYSMYDIIGVNVLRALGYNGIKYQRTTTKLVVNNPIKPLNSGSATQYVRLAIISTTGVDFHSKEFDVDTPGATKTGYIENHNYNENDTSNTYDGIDKKNVVDGFDTKCYVSFGVGCNVSSSKYFDFESSVTGYAGIIAAPTRYFGYDGDSDNYPADPTDSGGDEGIMGIAPETVISSFQLATTNGVVRNPYKTMYKAMTEYNEVDHKSEKNDIILFTDVSSAVGVVTYYDQQIPINRANSEDLYDVLKATNNNYTFAQNYFISNVANLYADTKDNIKASITGLYGNFSSIAKKDRPVFIFASGDDNLSNMTNIESAAPLVYPDLIGNFINVVAVDEYGKRYVTQHGNLVNNSDLWNEGSNGCGATMNWCLSAPGKDIIAPASGTGDLKTYATISNFINNFAGYQITGVTTGPADPNPGITNYYYDVAQASNGLLKVKDLGLLIGLYNAFISANQTSLTDSEPYETDPYTNYKFLNNLGDEVYNSAIFDQNGDLIYFRDDKKALIDPSTGNSTFDPSFNMMIGVWDYSTSQYLPMGAGVKYYIEYNNFKTPGFGAIESKYYFELKTETDQFGGVMPAGTKYLEWVNAGASDVTGRWKDTFSLANVNEFNGSEKTLYWEYNEASSLWVIENYTGMEYTYYLDGSSNLIFKDSSNLLYKFDGTNWESSSDGVIFNAVAMMALPQEQTGDPLLDFYLKINSRFAKYDTDGSTSVSPGIDYLIWNKSLSVYDLYSFDGAPINFDFFVKGSSSAVSSSDLLIDLEETHLGLTGIVKDINEDGYLIGVMYDLDPTSEGWKPWQYCEVASGACQWQTWTSVKDLSNTTDFDGDNSNTAGSGGSVVPDNDFYIDFYFIDTNGNGIYDPEDLLYIPQSGSAAAAAVVAGAVSALLGAYQHMTPDQVVSLLFLTSDDLGDTGVDAVYGQGLINLAKATRPYGSIVIPTDPKNFNWNAGHNSYAYNTTAAQSTATSTSRSGRGFELEHTYVALSSSFGDAVANSTLQFIVLDDFNRQFEMNFNSLVVAKPVGREIHIMMNEFGRSARETVKVTDAMSMSFGIQHNKEYTPRKGEEDPFIFNELTFNFATEEQKVTVSLGHNLNKALRFDQYETVPETAIVSSSFLGNPYLALAGQNAIGASYQTNISNNWSLGMTSFSGNIVANEIVDYYNMLPESDNRLGRITSSFTSVTRDFNRKGNVSFHAGVVVENKTMLGAGSYGALQIDHGTTTMFSTVASSFKLSSKTSMFGSYTIGTSQVSAARDSLFNEFSSIQTSSWNVGFAYKLAPRSTFGAVFAQPLRVNSASASMDIPIARDAVEDILYMNSYKLNLTPSATEYDMQMFYSWQAGDFEMDTGYMYRINPGHSSTLPDDHTIMMKFKYKI